MNKFMRFLLWLGQTGLNAVHPLFRPLAWVGRATGFVLLPAFRAVAWATRLDRVLPWNYLRLFATPYYTGERKHRAWLLTAATIALMIANAKAAYYLGVHVAALTEVINHKMPMALFYREIAWLVGLAAVFAVCNAHYGMFRTWLALDGRIYTTQVLLRQATVNEAPLRLAGMTDLDNLDQRFAQSPDTAFNTMIWLEMIILDAIVNIWTFGPLLFRTGWLLPVACLCCAAVSYAMVFFLGRHLPELTFQQIRSEADFRTTLQSMYRQAAIIVMQRAELLIVRKAMVRVNTVYNTLWNVMLTNRNINLFNVFWGRVIDHGPFAFIGWLFMQGKVANFGQILQGVQAFGKVYDGLTVLSSQFGAISTLKAEMNRIGPLIQALDDIGENRMPQGQWVDYSEGATVVYHKVTLINTFLSARPVVIDLDLEVDDDLMFAAMDGHGIEELSRATGLGVAAGAGTIQRPARSKIMYLTRTPFFPEQCTLREFLCDRWDGNGPDDAAINKALSEVELRDIVQQSGGLDSPQDFRTKLSPVTQLQLCLARVLLLRPELLISERATAGFEEEYEALIYKLIKAAGIRVISFSSDARLAKRHRWVVELKPDGTVERDENGHAKKIPGNEYQVPRWKLFLRNLTGETGE